MKTAIPGEDSSSPGIAGLRLSPFQASEASFSAKR